MEKTYNKPRRITIKFQWNQKDQRKVRKIWKYRKKMEKVGGVQNSGIIRN